jgi:NADH:ubiquinone oxidoreductase subunit 5 (subunit L)/multisubunit Na+/H+ antiporter MnhA subunit
MPDIIAAISSKGPLDVLTFVTLMSPAAGALLLVLLSITGIRLPERWVAWVSGITVAGAAISALLLGALTMLRPNHEFDDVLWTMYSVGEYQLDVEIFVDPLSAMLIMLGAAVIPVLARFSGRYLHNDPGYLRFFVLMGIAATGFFWFVLGGSIDMMFFGWELLGLSSALLVAFFWDRAEPVVASGRVFATYRVADIALLGGVVLLHHYVDDLSWAAVLGVGDPEHAAHLGSFAATILGLAFLLAAMGKSAQAPLTGYVLRAMEGPTTSSALFYGTLSIHAGVYLLLRVEPLISSSPVARTAVLVVGLTTAATAAVSSRVRADAKGSLALAAAGQCGLMLAEIGLGFTTLAMWHLLAHGLLRLAQFLRSPSWLQDAHERRRALGGGSFRAGFYIEKLLPLPLRRWVYAAALSRFGFDAFIDRLFSRPLSAFAHLVSYTRPRMRERPGTRIQTERPLPLQVTGSGPHVQAGHTKGPR